MTTARQAISRELPRRGAVGPDRPSPGPTSVALDGPLDEEGVLTLQALAGNTATVSRIERDRADSMIQRDDSGSDLSTPGWTKPSKQVGGWSGADSKGDAWNTGERDLGAMRRIPIDGLDVGRQGEEDAANDTLTDETAGRRAILVAPAGLALDSKVNVMVHLHGYTEKYSRSGKRVYRPYAGWRTKKGTGEVRDVALDQVEAQLLSVGDKHLVAILAQGGVHSDFGDSSDPYGMDPAAYAEGVLKRAAELEVWPKQPGLGQIIMSGHSGAGKTIAATLGKELGKKKSAEGKSRIAEVVLFDAINGADELKSVRGWIMERLEADLDELSGTATLADKTTYLATSTRFRGYYASYKDIYLSLEGSIIAWFRANAAKLGNFAEEVWTHYQVIDTGLGSGGHENAMRGSSPDNKTAKPSSGNIADAVSALHHATARKTLAETIGTAPAVTTRHARSGPKVKRRRAPATRDSSAPGSGETPTVPETKVATKSAGSAKVSATAPDTSANGPTPAPADSADPAATNAFIAAVDQNTLKLLPDKQRARFEAIEWVDLDYPDAKMKVEDTSEANLAAWSAKPGYVLYKVKDRSYLKGAHQADAQALFNALAKVRPGGGERRANSESTAILTKAQFKRDPAAYDQYIRDQLMDIDGEDSTMNTFAAASYVKMKAAAKAEGVRLSINNAFRDRKVAETNAAKADNAKAVASYSSHSLGLAADLNLRTGKKARKTVSTAMSNVMDLLATPAHKWMFMRGAAFGFYQYRNEPWHWEYNPVGFRDTFWAALPSLRPADGAEAKSSRKGKKT